MTTSDTKLASFLTYIANYLYVYRIKFNKSPADNVQLRFLANSTPDALTINCCTAEPLMAVGDYWYNGTVLRLCIGDAPEQQYGFSKTYKTCYTYNEAFTSTLISLNPEIVLDNGVTTTTPAPNFNVQYIKKSGDKMGGPLLLWRMPVEEMESAPKAYIDAETAKLAANDTKLGIRLTVAESGITNLTAALDLLDPNSTKLDDLVARIVSAESSVVAFTTVINEQGTNITDLQNRVSNLEQGKVGIASSTALGSIKIGKTLKVAADGTTDVAYLIGAATTTTNSKTNLDFDGKQFIPVAKATMFKISIIGLSNTEPTKGCAFEIQGLAINNAGTLALVGSPSMSLIANANPLWTASVDLDNVNKGLVVAVQGTNGSSITWSATVDLTVVA